MHRKGFLGLAVLAVGAVALSTPVASESLARWELARAELVAAQPRHSAQVVERWKLLNGNDRMRFDDYAGFRSEEHTSELQSLMRISYAVFCLKKKKKKQ